MSRRAAGADPPEEAFLAAMPKAELHLHFEGSIRPPVLLELARRRRMPLPADDEEGVRRWLEFRDFEHFVEIYVLISRCLRDPEDFQLVARDILAELERQNVRYAEVHFTISTHIAHGANAGEVGDALAETLAEEERARGVAMRLIPDIVRNLPVERADWTLEWALEHRDRGVVALGLGGIESHPAAPFAEHFAAAAAEGLRRVAHAGEQEGPESIREALASCGAERIGHGVRAVEDPELMEELAARAVPLEVCPSSNVRLGVVSELAAHPFPQLWDAGLTLTLNSDDPPLFGTTLSREYRLARRWFGLGPEQLAGLSLQAVRSSFLPAAERRRLEEEFRSGFAEHGERFLDHAVAPALPGLPR